MLFIVRVNWTLGPSGQHDVPSVASDFILISKMFFWTRCWGRRERSSLLEDLLFLRERGRRCAVGAAGQLLLGRSGAFAFAIFHVRLSPVGLTCSSAETGGSSATETVICFLPAVGQLDWHCECQTAVRHRSRSHRRSTASRASVRYRARSKAWNPNPHTGIACSFGQPFALGIGEREALHCGRQHRGVDTGLALRAASAATGSGCHWLLSLIASTSTSLRRSSTNGSRWHRARTLSARRSNDPQTLRRDTRGWISTRRFCTAAGGCAFQSERVIAAGPCDSLARTGRRTSVSIKLRSTATSPLRHNDRLAEFRAHLARLVRH